MRVKKEKVDPETQRAVLGRAIQAIDLFQTVAVVSNLVLPNPLGDILKNVTGMLGNLQVCPLSGS
jgi:hypothetical protein